MSDMDRMRELVAKLNDAAKVYYQGEDELMTNFEYDALYDELAALEKKTGIVLSGSPTTQVGYETLSELPKEPHIAPMLSLGKTKEREELAVINDQFGAPTGAELLADCTAHAIRVALNKPEVAGLYHLVASGTTTWHDYAALVFEEARKAGIALALNKLNAVPTTAYPTPARRPHNSRLDTEKFQQNFALVLPDWKIGVKRMLNELFTTTAI